MKHIIRFTACCLILCICASFSVKETPDFTVISYNVWNGFESQDQRRDTFVRWAKGQNADVIAFQELNNFTQASFSELAKGWGHPYAVICKESGYPVGISSRYPITNVYKLKKDMHHGCLYAEVKGISFFVVHFSPFSSEKRLQEAANVFKILKEKQKLNKLTAVLGDFNAFSPKDSLFYSSAFTRDSMHLAEKSNKILQNLNEDNEIDYKVLHHFLDAGFSDGFSLFHKTFDNSYPSKVYPVPVSGLSRIDHVLISEKLKEKCKRTAIIKDDVTDSLSDHYPVKAIFSLTN